MGKNKALVNFIDNRGLLLGRKMRSEKTEVSPLCDKAQLDSFEFFVFKLSELSDSTWMCLVSSQLRLQISWNDTEKQR